MHGPDHCEGFVPAGASHGHVVVCNSCGRASEFTDCDAQSLVSAAARQTGYVITDHFLQLSGVCPACRTSAAPVSPEASRMSRNHALGRCLRRLLCAATLAAAALATTGCGGDPQSSAEEPLSVVATASFLADIAQNVAGDRFTVTSLVPRGTDLHGFEPATRDVARVSEADLFILNGGGLEGTLEDTLRSAAPDTTFVAPRRASRRGRRSPASP